MKDEGTGKPNGCGDEQSTKIMIKEKMRIFKEGRRKGSETLEELTALKVKAIFERISSTERKLLGFTYSKPTDFLISTLLVPPPQIRTVVEHGP